MANWLEKIEDVGFFLLKLGEYGPLQICRVNGGFQDAGSSENQNSLSASTSAYW